MSTYCFRITSYQVSKLCDIIVDLINDNIPVGMYLRQYLPGPFYKDAFEARRTTPTTLFPADMKIVQVIPYFSQEKCVVKDNSSLIVACTSLKTNHGR